MSPQRQRTEDFKKEHRLTIIVHPSSPTRGRVAPLMDIQQPRPSMAGADYTIRNGKCQSKLKTLINEFVDISHQTEQLKKERD